MSELFLHALHERLNGQFDQWNGCEVVRSYGDPGREYEFLQKGCAILDLGFRSRICLLGADRVRLLNGQVTNNVKDLKPGEGLYAALVTNKGKLQSDLNVYCLAAELLLDFEPGLTERVTQRLEKYIIADDVQIVDVSSSHGLLSFQGPRAAELAGALGLGLAVPDRPWTFTTTKHPEWGEIYLMQAARAGSESGFDLFLPSAALEAAANAALSAAGSFGGGPCGMRAAETARIEAGIPRFGVDMDEANLAPEAGLENRAISYNKGCYIGQEIIARIRTYGQVARALRGLKLADGLAQLPEKGDKLFADGKEAGYITSAVASPRFSANLALGYVRREFNAVGTRLLLRSASGESPVEVVQLPF